MKQVLSIILLLMLNVKIAAQYQDNNNRFNEEQNINNINSFQQSEESEQESEQQTDIPNEEPQKGIGNPGEPAPINQYTLVLLGFAIVGIFLARKKINIQEQN
ncbi:hypothetical protein SAMN05660477_02082 [Soonwooa buanensis]|uniref:PEP-CTERM protein-sorting domain-containing protein n=1 Tax=Soonwooa buanensis TaxID=619805 RepID=A0A1T5FIC6_9FLAO|nr:hypothetical protein [Soonwooa buanensis]SKB95842.1 hypothetical protein SAMN05660477_02082 [Soonwooa buanensis]